MFKNLFSKLLNNKLIQQDEQDDYLDAVNRAKMLNGGNGNAIATPEQASVLANELKKINANLGGENAFNLPSAAQNKQSNLYEKIKDNMLGQKITSDINSSVENDENGNPILKTGTSNDLRQGGILPDIFNGARENYNNKFDLNNLDDKLTQDGRNKGFAYRIGEGLGSVGRFLESPAGRALIVGGLVGASGGSGLEALAYGASAGAGNQQNRYNDKLYRNDLIQNAKQQLINSPEFNTLNDTEKAQILTDLQNDANFTALTDENAKQNMIDEATRAYLGNRQNSQLKELEDNINNMRGYVTNDTYNNLMKSQQIRDNYAYRNMMLNNQLEQNRIMNQLRKDQFEATKAQQEFNRNMAIANLDEKRADRASRTAYQNAQLGLGYAKLNADKQEKLNKEHDKNKEKIETLNQLDTMMEMFNKLPQSNTPKGLQKGRALVTAGLNSFGLQNDDETAFNSIRPLMVSRVMRKLQEERGVATDKDFDRASAMVPASSDSPQQAKAKVAAIQGLFAGGTSAQKVINNYYGNNVPKGGNGSRVTTVGKYKVTVK